MPSEEVVAGIRGLTAREVEARRAAGQINRMPVKTSRSYAQILKENVFTFINIVLFTLGALLVLLDRPSDAIVSVGVILANVIVSVVQEIRAKRMLDRIALLTRPTATVVRDSREQQVDPAEIVAGDVLVLRPGDQIVVDGPLLGDERRDQPGARPSSVLDVDESLLTGESDLVPKRPGDRVYSGSFCVNGSGMYRAEAVGDQSLANQITRAARAYRRVLTPLQRQIGLMLRVVLLVAAYLGVLLAVDTLLRGIPLVESVRMSVVILGLVPNGLFLAIAVAYALGAVRIAGHGALVQQSNAVESLSNVDVLCLDKTGTLTANRIRYHDVWAYDQDKETLKQALGDFAANGSSGNQTSAALAAACPGQKLPAVHEVAFSSQRKWSGLTFDGEGRRGTFVLGAPEVVAPTLRVETTLPPDTPSAPTGAQRQFVTWTELGLRVLLFAWHQEPTHLQGADGTPILPPGLIPLGLVAFSDELRPEAQQTLAAFSASGVQVKIISGDNPGTVAALARQAGLGPDLEIISGLELAQMDGTRFAQAAASATVFGRITPQQKEQIVRALQDRGHYVAMTGDGVNDVLSLKQANLGIAMQSGSQATRSVADILLLDDSFAALPYAVSEGQRIVNGMQDILKLFLTRVFYAAILIVSMGILGVFPFTPKHNSLLTLFTVGIPTLALAAWARPGSFRRIDLVRRVWHFVLPAVLTISVTALLVYLVHLVPAFREFVEANPLASEMAASAASMPRAQTALTVFAVICGLLLVVFVEPPTKAWTGGDELSGDHRPALLAVGLLLLFGVVLAIPPLRRFFELSTLSPAELALIGVLAALWALALRRIWRVRLIERFIGADLWPGRDTSSR